MWGMIKSALVGLLGSKKVQSTILGALAALLTRHLISDEFLAAEIASGIMLIFMTLVGAQGLADFGKAGVVPPPQTVLEAVKYVFVSLLGSKKFLTAVFGAVAFALVKWLNLDSGVATAVSDGLLGVVLALIGAQGLTDFKKEAITHQSDSANQSK